MFLNKKPVVKQEGFQPIDLNEDNVQAIFSRRLVKPSSTEKTSSILFYREFGWEKDDVGIGFDKAALHASRKTIELYGQLYAVHEYENIIRIEDFARAYTGQNWTDNKSSIYQWGIILCIEQAHPLPERPEARKGEWED